MVLDFIKNRRTIRKYKKDMPDRGILEEIYSAIRDVLSYYPMPFKLYILLGSSRDKATKIMRLNYSAVKDIAILGKIVPEEFKPYFENLMQEFLKDLGGAPITFIGLTKLYDWMDKNWPEDRVYNFKVSWMIAQIIMLVAKKNGLDTGSFTFSNITVEKEMLEFLGEKELNIAFALNLGYADENPIPKEVEWKVVEI
ncbi:MAG: nitroreductase family protein [candidate division WOR-3 bacterium]